MWFSFVEGRDGPNLHSPVVVGLKRFVVAEASMSPALEPGDGVIARRTARVRRGEIRCFEHPAHDGFWLVKRVGAVQGHRFEALSDNPDAGAVDSRVFGLVPIAGSYRVLVRVPRRFLR